ncbi:MAG: ABC transporter permease subunit [Planctomycetota bacterium]
MPGPVRTSDPLRPAAQPSRALVLVALAVFGVLALGPVAIMGQRIAAEPAALESLGDPRVIDLLVRTVLLGLGAAGIALAIGLPFGFLVARTNVFGASALRALGIVPILLPPIMLAMTWTMLLPLRGPWMCAFILGVSSFPLVSLFAARAAERIDARREEAALLTGGLRAVVRMELPLVLRPALGGALLAFIVAINEFALPDYVSSVGKKFNVYAGEVFSSWQVDGNEARAVVKAIPIVALTLIALVPILVARRGRSETIDASFQRPSPLRLGRWRLPATLFCLAAVTVGALLPLGRLAYESGGGSRVFSGVSIRRMGWTQGGGAAQNMPTTAPPTAAATSADARKEAVRAVQAAARAAAGQDPIDPKANTVAQATPLQRRRSVDFNAPEVKATEAAKKGDDVSDFGQGWPRFRENLVKAFVRALDLSRGSLISSLLFALIAATIALPIALVLGHAVARSRLGPLLTMLAIVPIAVPGTLFGIGTIVLWNHAATASIYDSGALVVLLFAGRFLAVPILICAGAVRSYDARLEESAHLVGAGPIKRLFTVVAPGVWTSLVGSWIVVFALSVRELDAAVLVPAANDTAMFRVFNAVHFGRDDFVSALSLLVVFAILLPGMLWSSFGRTRPRFLP